ncbi:MAG: hypothetical protein WCJ30_11980 [Deltaproteobacteria bacterium]
MAIWTSGESIVIATGWGVARMAGKDPRVARFPRGALTRDEDPPALVGFAVVDEGGESALVQREREPVMLWSAEPKSGTLTRCDGADGVLCVAGTGPARLALMVRDADSPGGVALRAGHMEGDTLVAGNVVALPAAGRAQWNSGMIKPGEGWPEDRDRDPDDAAERFDPLALNAEYESSKGPWWRGRVTLHANRHGIALASTYNGMVSVLDPETLVPRFAVRMPTLGEQFEIFVLPLDDGALVTLVANYRHAEFVLLDAKGTPRAQRHNFGKDLAWGPSTPGIAWDDSAVLVNQSLSDDQVMALKLPDLAARRHGKDPGFAVDAGTSPDGNTHVVALALAGHLRPHGWQLTRWRRSGAKWKSEALEMPDFRPVQKPVALADPGARRAEGSPSLAVIADVATPWRAVAGEETVLRIHVGNRGGVASGLYIEIAGDAVEQQHVEALQVTPGGDGPPIPFAAGRTSARAEMPAAMVPAGFLPPAVSGGPKPPPQPVVTFLVKVRARKSGQALMTVRVGPSKGTSGSGMAGRSFVVTE